MAGRHVPRGHLHERGRVSGTDLLRHSRTAARNAHPDGKLIRLGGWPMIGQSLPFSSTSWRGRLSISPHV